MSSALSRRTASSVAATCCVVAAILASALARSATAWSRSSSTASWFRLRPARVTEALRSPCSRASSSCRAAISRLRSARMRLPGTQPRRELRLAPAQVLQRREQRAPPACPDRARCIARPSPACGRARRRSCRAAAAAPQRRPSRPAGLPPAPARRCSSRSRCRSKLAMLCERRNTPSAASACPSAAFSRATSPSTIEVCGST